MIEYSEQHTKLIPLAVTIVLKQLCCALDEQLPERTLMVSARMSTDGQHTVKAAIVDIKDGVATFPYGMNMTPDGMSAYQTHVIHESADRSDFLIVNVAAQEGEIDEHGNAVFSVVSRYYSLSQCQRMNDPIKLSEAVDSIVRELTVD